MGVIEPDVRELVRRAQASDPDAWEALYRRAYPGLFAYARRRVACWAEADDAVGETFARAYDAIGRFEWRGSGIDGWMFGILRNVVLEANRQATRRAIPTRLDGHAPDDPLERVLGDEETAAMRVAFGRLPPDDQEVLELRVIGGLDADAVAAVIGKRPGAVRMAQHRALVRLRASLEEVDRG